MHSKAVLKKPALAAVALVFTLAVGSSAAAVDNAPPRLPDVFMAHASMRSVSEALRATDAFAVSVTRGTGVQLIPGMLPMFFQMYMPFSSDAWNMDGEAHILVPAGRKPELHHAVLLSGGFENFISVLREDGVTMEEDPDSGCLVVGVRGIGRYFVEDGGDNLILFASSGYMVNAYRTAVEEGWRPRHWGDGVLCADVAVPGGWVRDLGFDREMEDALARARDDARRNGGGEADIEKADAVIDICEKIVNWLVAEAEHIAAAGVDVRLDGSRVGLGIRTLSSPESTLGKLAAAASVLPNSVTPLIENIPAGATVMTTSTSLNKLYPTVSGDVESFFAGILDKFVPEHKDLLLALQRELVAHGGNENAVASFIDNGVAYNISWIKSGEPDKVLAAYRELLNITNEIVNADTPNPEMSLSMTVADKVASFGAPYLFAGVAQPDPGRFAELLERLRDDNPSIARNMEMLSDFGVMLAEADGCAVVVSGAVNEDLLRMGLDYAAGAPTPLVAGKAAQAAIDDLNYRQITFSLFDVHRLFLGVVDSIVEAYADENGGDAEDYFDALDDIKPRFRAVDEFVGASFGASNDWLVYDMTMTVDAINALRRNYALLVGAMEEVDRSYGADNSVDEEEDDNDEDGDGMNDGEDGDPENDTAIEKEGNILFAP